MKPKKELIEKKKQSEAKPANEQPKASLMFPTSTFEQRQHWLHNRNKKSAQLRMEFASGFKTVPTTDEPPRIAERKAEEKPAVGSIVYDKVVNGFTGKVVGRSPRVNLA